MSASGPSGPLVCQTFLRVNISRGSTLFVEVYYVFKAGLQIRVYNGFFFCIKTNVVGTQNNHLNEKLIFLFLNQHMCVCVLKRTISMTNS